MHSGMAEGHLCECGAGHVTPSVRHRGTSQGLWLTAGVVVTRTVNREYCLHLTAFLYLRTDPILHTLQLVKRRHEKKKTYWSACR